MSIKVYLLLAHRADSTTRCCWPSIASIARDVGPVNAHAVFPPAPRIFGVMRSSRQAGQTTRYDLPGNPLPPLMTGATDCRDPATHCPTPATDCRGGGNPLPPNKNQRTRTNKQKPSNKNQTVPRAPGVPAGLVELIYGWNELGDQIVMPGNGARATRFSGRAIRLEKRQ